MSSEAKTRKHRWDGVDVTLRFKPGERVLEAEYRGVLGRVSIREGRLPYDVWIGYGNETELMESYAVPGPAFERLLAAVVDLGRRKAAVEETLGKAWSLLCQSVESGSRGRGEDR